MLDGHASQIDQFFEQLPCAGVIAESYARFLYGIGSHSLPGAFLVLARRLRVGNPREMLITANTLFFFEATLARFVYGNPLQLKAEPEYRNAVLYLLDVLADNGSSAAYRMRDDFVTPLPPAVAAKFGR